MAASLAEFPSVLQQKQKEDQAYFDHQNNHHDQSSTQGAKAYQEHLAEIQRQSQLHSIRSNNSSLFASSHKGLSQAEMMAAQQHLGFSPVQQIKSERNLDDSGMISPQDQTQWQDDQEQFLRNLLSTPLEDVSHSMSSTSGASFHSQSPPQPNQGSISGDDAGRYSSLSPVSSTGYQSLHDFIHGGSISSSSTTSGNGIPFGGFPTPPDGDAKGSALHLSHLKQDPMSNQYDYGQGQHPGLMDAGAINFFMNTIANQQDQQKFSTQVPPHIMAQHMAMHGNHNISLPMNMNVNANPQMPMQSFASDNQQFNFQAPGGMQPNFNGMLNQQAQMQQYPMDPSTDPRKRSAPMPSTSNDVHLHEQMQSNVQPNNKRPRKLSAKEAAAQQQQQQSVPLYGAMQGATSFMPRMEVGSNATALAAIERLKAKKRAEQEMKAQTAKLEEQNKSNRLNGGMMNNGIGSSSNGMPIIKSEKKVAHNAIERRYRNNINARIAALRNAVPALHELRPKRPTRRGKEAPPEDLVDGVPAATKLNKATILGKATEYIRYLKGRETRLVSEVAGLRELIRSLEGGEELLDLWQGEMERVVAEQEAIARAAFALEDDSLDIGDDEDEEDDEDDMEPHKTSRSPASNRSSSSRYMMGIFMGFSILGGGAEMLHNENAASTSSSYSPAGHAHHVLRASSGRVIGASHQLLKRGMQATNVKFGTLAHEPHHFDHVPHHLLIVEVLRGATLIACLVFIFWPLISSFLPRQESERPVKKRRQSNKPVFIQENEASIALERKKMLMVMADSAASPYQVDLAMRKFVRAPTGVVRSTLSLVTLSAKEILYRSGLSPRVKRSHDEERAAIWSRLLELETSLGPLAQRSLLARMHTLLMVSTSSFVGFGTQSGLPLLHPARVYGTLAIALVRASSSNAIVTSFADRYWTMARRCRLLAADGGVDENNVTQVTDRWLDPVLELSLTDAVSLCPIPTQIASFFSQHSDSNTRATMISPLLCIAASQHGKQLATIWSTLLCQIAKTTCPSSPVSNEQGDDQSRSPTCADFVKHHADVKIALPILNDLGDRDRLTSQITRLTLTAPRCPRLQIICNVTFGTWALLLGNASVARDVAIALLRTGEEEVLAMPACAKAFIALVLDGQKGNEEGDAEIADVLQNSLSAGAVPMNEADALAAATISWLSFLRTLSTYLTEDSTKTDGNKIAQSTISIRRLLASARACRPILTEESLIELRDVSYSKQYPSGHRDSLASTLSTAPSVTASEAGSLTTEHTAKLAAQHNFDDALDTLTDILAVLGKRAASGGEFSKEKLLQPDENVDSGVEWSL